MCSATSRVLVADELADEFLIRLQARAEKIRVADPFDPEVEMGALVNQTQYQRVLGHIDRGLSAGAKLILLPKYSPDLNPIEQFFAKLKHWLRKAAKRSVETVCQAIAEVLNCTTPQECSNYFAQAGYDRQ